MPVLFRDRVEAGKRLAEQLAKLSLVDPLVLAIPRGGVSIGYQVARALRGELDIVVPRKLGAPGDPELAIGAVMHDGSTYLNEEMLSLTGSTATYIKSEKKQQMEEAQRRLRRYRGDRAYPNLRGRTVIVVDDGVATGATMITALRWAKEHGAESVVAAMPLASREALQKLEQEADRVVCVHSPEPFYSIGQFFADFNAVEDDEVIELLKNARADGPK